MALGDRTLLFTKEKRMRGEAGEPEAMFSYITPAQRVPQDHPLRGIRKIVDAALDRMSPRFQRLYSRTGRPSIPPERLLRALSFRCFTPFVASASSSSTSTTTSSSAGSWG